jgi:hypothetical protein
MLKELKFIQKVHEKLSKGWWIIVNKKNTKWQITAKLSRIKKVTVHVRLIFVCKSGSA